jgi:AraC-like DNA-binding protein
MKTHLLNNHCRFVTEDLDLSREVQRGLWEHHELYLNSGWKYGIRWHQVDLKHTSLSYLHSPTSVRVVKGPRSHTYRFGFHCDGTSRYNINGYESIVRPGLAILNAPGQMVDAQTNPHRLLALTLDGTFVDKALTRRFGRVPPFEEWAREFELRSGPSACLQSLMFWMAKELDSPECWLLALPPAALRLERAMLGLFLDCLGERRPASRRPCDDLATKHVKRVEEWIDAHYGDAVTIDDLAEVAGISVRSLQESFRRLRNCTPMEALARRRLRAACDALRTPEATVTQVATDCGFFHLGRFASRYREVFGEAPSATLSRARQR